MRGRARGGRQAAFDRMPLVACVLEMLWAVQPSIEVDLGRWGTFRRVPWPPAAPPEARGRDGGTAGAGARPGGSGGPGGPGGAGDPGSSTRWQPGRDARRRRWTRRQRPGRSSSGAAAGAAAAPALDPALRRCYQELGVQVGARLDVVRSAWRRLVREHHPDRHAGDPERQRRGTERLKEINRSYDRLKRWLGQGG
jgi:hypothetical protein